MKNSLPDRLNVGQVKRIMKMLQIALNNAHDKRPFIETAVNPQDIVDLIKGE